MFDLHPQASFLGRILNGRKLEDYADFTAKRSNLRRHEEPRIGGIEEKRLRDGN